MNFPGGHPSCSSRSLFRLLESSWQERKREAHPAAEPWTPETLPQFGAAEASAAYARSNSSLAKLACVKGSFLSHSGLATSTPQRDPFQALKQQRIIWGFCCFLR